MSDIVDTVVSKSDNLERGSGFSSRPPVTEVIEENNTIATVDGADEFSDGRPDRDLPQSVVVRLAKLEPEEDEEPAEVEAAAADPVEPVVEARPAEPAAPVVSATPVEPADVADLRARAERFEATNAKLVADLEAARTAKPQRSKREQLLDEAERDYLEDSTLSVRKLIAAGLGLEDPQHADVTAELAGLYGDLTAKELGVTPDPAHQATRESARTRQLLAREKRERKAEGQTSAEAEATAKEAKAKASDVVIVGNRLQTKNGDRSIADEYPLLMDLSETFDGHKPETLIVEVLYRDIKTGRLDPSKQTVDQMIAETAKSIESHYQALVAKATQASTRISQPSTAKPNAPASAAAQSAKNETRQDHGTRTLTAADASVAPATAPAKKPAPAKTERPKFKNNEERKDWSLRHLDK